MIDFIKRLFKKPLPNTAIHPKYKTLIEKVAKIKGRQLYQFKNLLDMPSSRYSQCSRFTTEFTMRLDADILKTSIKDCLEYANEGNFTKVIGILTLLQEHTNMLLSLSASYRLASCVYFWYDENLDNYDFEIGDEKIRLFKEIGFESFFLTKPMNNFVPQMNISAQDLEAYSQYEKELKKLLGNQLKPQTAKKEKVI
jgi:hypothetical protein